MIFVINVCIKLKKSVFADIFMKEEYIFLPFFLCGNQSFRSHLGYVSEIMMLSMTIVKISTEIICFDLGNAFSAVHIRGICKTEAKIFGKVP